MVMQTKLDGHKTSFFLIKRTDRSIASRRREGGVAGFALSLQGLPPSQPHMNSLQRTWIFQGIDVQMHSDAGWDPGSVKDLLWCLSEALLFSCCWTRRLVETEAAVATLSWLWNSDVPQRLMKCGHVSEKALDFTSPHSIILVLPFGFLLILRLKLHFCTRLRVIFVV